MNRRRTVNSFLAALASLVLITPALSAQTNEIDTAKLVGWMRVLNTLQFEYRMSKNRFADTQELLSFARSHKEPIAVAFAKDLGSKGSQPYSLRMITSPDGKHYSATIAVPADPKDKATWCKTAAFSDDTALISLGQNIDCPGVQALGSSRK